MANPLAGILQLSALWKVVFFAVLTLAGYFSGVLLVPGGAGQGQAPSAEPEVREVRVPVQVEYLTLDTPDTEYTQALAEIIEGAQSQIWACVRDIRSREVLLAMVDRAQAGVDVRVVFSPDKNAREDAGAVAFLRRSGVAEAVIDGLDNHSQFFIIDGQTLVLAPQPASVRSQAESAGIALFVYKPNYIADYKTFFVQRLRAARNRNAPPI